MIDGKKFVKKRNQWYLVKPIRWFYDEEKRLLETQESIYGYMEMPQGKSLDNEMNLSVYSSIMSIGLKEYDIRQEEKQNAIDMYNDAERLRKSKEEKERVNRELKQKQEEEQKRNLEKDKELEEIEKQNLEDLDIIASAVERINERNNRAISLGVSPISVNRVHIDDELLLIKTEEYVMFNPAYVKLLRYIDLSSISSEKFSSSNNESLFIELSLSLLIYSNCGKLIFIKRIEYSLTFVSTFFLILTFILSLLIFEFLFII